MHRRRATLPARRLVALLVLIGVTGCGYVGIDLLPPEDGALPDGGSADAGPQVEPDSAMMPMAAPLDPGKVDVCISGHCASQVDRCPASDRDWGGLCGCTGSDVDSDKDGTPDCDESCPGSPDRLAGGVCGCALGMQDADRDGVPNCNDLCVGDPLKALPGICGCNVSDVDADGDTMPDCADACPIDPKKTVAGSCGCGAPETDTDMDGMPDCVDVCSGLNDASYVSISDCGVGYCRTMNMPSSCMAGLELACMPGLPRSSSDTTCDGVDDDCSGASDEDYVVVAQCGVGYCRTTSVASRCSAGVETACKAGSARSATDATCDGVDDDCSGAVDEDYVVNSTCGVGYCRTNNTPSKCRAGVQTLCAPAAPRAPNDVTPDGVDDDCDGQVDEDACVPRTDTYAYRAAVYAFTPPAGCTKATVKLWGGAGASGSNDGGSWGVGITGGQGGAGGFAQTVLTVGASSMLQLYVGQGGQGCGAASTSFATYRGGAGGNGNGTDGSAGANGSVAGGNGGNPGSGGKGGNGSFGGGGGGAGAKLYTSSGAGGDGGGATVLLLSGTRSATAGGGAGGGGAGSTFVASGVSGANGGTG
ncbi:MAG: symbB, partial [Myxococcaceae bacterium]|nr:symbB [Myxococcaceae bacterium]